MPKLLCILMLVLAGVGPAVAADKKEPPKKAAKGPLTLPKDAVRIEPLMYRYTDPDGKIWIYRETPFGLVRYEEEAKPEAASSSTSGPRIRATDDGDKVRFEKQGPFGTYRWTKKKTELNKEERAALEDSLKRQKPLKKNPTTAKQEDN